MRVIVAGAGIGGLSAALSLHAAGIDVAVIDAASSLRPLGVGINLMPHAVRELTELGLGDELEATGIPTAELVHFDRHGNRIWGFASGLNIGYRWPQYSIHRGELQMILLAAARARLGPDAVRAGTAFASFAESPAGVEVRVRDRAAGSEAVLRGDVLVGADGLYSAVRAQLHPGEPPPRWGGVMMWRGVTQGAPFLTGRTVAVAGTNAALKFVAYPISRRAERRGRALINWVAEVMLPEPAGVDTADWNRPGRVEDVLPWFADWKFGWLDVPALITGAPQILEYPMVDRDPLPWWGSARPDGQGRVTLLGDAAHPMYPIGANGGSQAVLDARVLAWSLSRSGTPAEGLAAYEAARRDTVNAIVLACRDMPADRLLQTVSTRAPGGFGRIEDVLSAAELAAFDRAYRSTTLPDVAALNSRPSLTPLVPGGLGGLADVAVGREDQETVEGPGEPAVVGDREHGALVELQALLQRLGARQVEVVGRLVEQQQRRAGEFQQQDLEPGLLAAGQGAERLPGTGLQLVPGQRGHRLVDQQRVLGHQDLGRGPPGQVGPGMGLGEEAGHHPGPEPRLPLVRHLLPREQPQEARLA
jgi:2-polyprenyl-6-methoxyphenol hydroxylase-like FAD-dependent oxidoreductase